MNVLYPAFTMMALTFYCLVRLGILRMNAVRSGEVDSRFYSLYRGYEEPEKLALYSRHVIHHFETPVLFYILCITAFVTGQGSVTVVGLAWAYVALRFVHSYVHLAGNIVPVRFRIFVVSMIVLALMWGVLLTGIMRQ